MTSKYLKVGDPEPVPARDRPPRMAQGRARAALRELLAFMPLAGDSLPHAVVVAAAAALAWLGAGR